MKVWIVMQHRADSDLESSIIGVFDSKDKAQAECREYNKNYADSVGVNSLYDWTGEITDETCYQYYEFFSMVVE